MVQQRVTQQDFLTFGGVILRRCLNPNSLEDLREFRSHFGVAPRTCVALWIRINRSLPPNATPYHLLWTLLYMKVYASEFILSGMAGVKTRTTYRKWVKVVMKSIAGLAPSVIRWSNRFRGDRGRQCKTTVDGTDFRIPEPHPFSRKWFTKKFNGPGVRYEVAICIQTGDIVWINGPYPCGQWPDLKIFRHKLKHLLPAGEKVEADKGYRGEPNHVRLPGNAVSKADKAAKEAARARHETGNRLFKRWGCLFQCYRHDIDDHYLHFASVAVCVQLALEHGEPMYDVRY